MARSRTLPVLLIAATTLAAPAAALADAARSTPPTPPTSTPEGAAATTTPASTTVEPAPSSTGSAPPTTLGPDPAVTLTEYVSLDHPPVDIGWRAGDDRVFVATQAGQVVAVAADGSTAVVLDLASSVSSGGEQGLLGLAFGPDGTALYVDYTDTEGDTIVSEFPVAADGTIDPETERLLLRIEQPYDNHNGGMIRFGPDGMLYIGTGDGGAAGDPERHASDLTSLLGKLLRIDPTPSETEPYTIPADNPFVANPDVRSEVWAYGLRNPWRFTFEANGDLWIADVGQSAWEEVNRAVATNGLDAAKGANFGWSGLEADAAYNADVTTDGAVAPWYSYEHSDGNCSISGGVRANDPAVPALLGWYVYADYCSGIVTAVEVTPEGGTGRIVELGTSEAVTAVLPGPTGTVYVLSATGRIDAVVAA